MRIWLLCLGPRLPIVVRMDAPVWRRELEMSGLQMGVAARRQIGRGALALGLALVVLCAQAQNLAEPDYQGVALKWAKAAAAGAVL